MPGLIERYRDRLPFGPDDPIVSLQEGSTPLVYACEVSERVGAQVSERFAVPRGTPWGPLGPTWYVFYIVMFYPSTGISVISGDS